MPEDPSFTELYGGNPHSAMLKSIRIEFDSLRSGQASLPESNADGTGILIPLRDSYSTIQGYTPVYQLPVVGGLSLNYTPEGERLVIEATAMPEPEAWRIYRRPHSDVPDAPWTLWRTVGTVQGSEGVMLARETAVGVAYDYSVRGERGGLVVGPPSTIITYTWQGDLLAGSIVSHTATGFAGDFTFVLTEVTGVDTYEILIRNTDHVAWYGMGAGGATQLVTMPEGSYQIAVQMVRAGLVGPVVRCGRVSNEGLEPATGMEVAVSQLRSGKMRFLCSGTGWDQVRAYMRPLGAADWIYVGMASPGGGTSAVVLSSSAVAAGSYEWVVVDFSSGFCRDTGHISGTVLAQNTDLLQLGVNGEMAAVLPVKTLSAASGWQTLNGWTVLSDRDGIWNGDRFAAGPGELWEAVLSFTIECGSGNLAHAQLGWLPINAGTPDSTAVLANNGRVVGANRFMVVEYTALLSGAADREYRPKMTFTSAATGSPFIWAGGSLRIRRLI